MASLCWAQNFYSVQKEATLGASLARDVGRQTTVVDSAGVQAYVNRLVRKIAAGFPQAEFPFTVMVTGPLKNYAQQELTVLPGGYIIVTSDMVATAHNEAEFGGLLAHAMAHSAERHGTFPATRDDVNGKALMPILYFELIYPAEASTPPSTEEIYMRHFEWPADSLAASAMAEAGYDPRALLTYLLREQPRNRTQRLGPLQAKIRGMAPRNYDAPEASVFTRFQQVVRLAVSAN